MTDPSADARMDSRKAREMVARFLSLAGIEDPQLTAEAERLLHRQIAEIGQQGFRESDLAVIGQAYIRSVGRIVAAETEAVFRLTHAASGGSETQMTQLAEHLLPLGRDVFDVLHGLLLRRTVSGSSGGLDRSRRSRRPTAIAHVDVIGSTALLERATLSDTQRLVDGLFSAAQSAIRGRSVEVTKYVGDGVFLVGTEAADVAAASLDCMESLARNVGLRARAGLALGPVVHRAGDVFGLPVNLSHLLTKEADEGTLLATAVGPARLPGAMCRHPREVTVRGLDAPLEAYELRAAE
jgi:class 3 adenylate cyclase